MSDRIEPNPIATYRVQLTPAFGFADTIGIIDHLVALGISHLYLSPVAEAVPGSLHGYDVIDHTRVRADFGGADGLGALLDAAADRDLGVIIDHVPNHMSVAEAHLNVRWWEMLRDGRRSPSSAWFDVDWDAADGRVIVPKLGDPLDDVLAAGALSIVDGEEGPELHYGPLRFPLAPGTEQLEIAEAVDRQHYRLQWWRDPARNVRRFFTIDDLVAIRAEDPAVAATIDTIPAQLADHRAFAGVRVDHVDGLARPEAYLQSLRGRIGANRWLLVEKILAVGETLPASWPVDGTTGYEHIRVTDHALLPSNADEPLTRLWEELTGDERSFEEIEDAARREVLDAGLRPDLDRLVRLIGDDSGDIAPPDRVREAVVELTIGLHRYRTYLPDDADSDEELDVAHRRAKLARPDLADELERLVAAIRGDAAIAGRWQQLTSPVMAKGAEDRAFYRYVRLAALCEVGGAPGQFTLPLAAFHDHQRQVQVDMPMTLLAGTTHDTKRSEGVRARALALAEVADAWAAAVRRWIAEHHDRVRVLDAATVLLALETAVTAWPIDAGRLTEYLVKSTREADLHTSWTEPDEAYEAALARLADTITDDLAEPTGSALGEIVIRTTRPGWARSLGTLLVRLTAPGVPDLYQGTVAFTYSLVDPDNRIEPDWGERRSLVQRAGGLDGPSAWIGDEIEAAKAVVVLRSLALRRRRAAVFGPDGRYVALDAAGAHAERVLAFARADAAGAQVVAIVAMQSVGEWSDTTVVLPGGSWRNVLDDDGQVVDGGGPVNIGVWLTRFPVALLDRVSS